MLGDSITYRADWRRLFPGSDISNAGWPDDTLEGLWNRLDAIVAAKPNKVFLMIGINNLYRDVPIVDLVRSYERVLYKLSQSETLVYVQSTLLTALLFRPEINERVTAFNTGLRAVCASTIRCTYIDLNSRLAPDGILKYPADGVHLDPEAYRIWRDAIAPYLLQ